MLSGCTVSTIPLASGTFATGCPVVAGSLGGITLQYTTIRTITTAAPRSTTPTTRSTIYQVNNPFLGDSPDEPDDEDEPDGPGEAI